MTKAFAVAWAEYLNAVRSKAFLIGLAIMPIMIAVIVGMQKLASEHVDVTDRPIAIVDETGRLAQPILAASRQYNDTEAFETDESGVRRQVKPRFVVEIVDPAAADGARIDIELSQRIRDGQLFAFAILRADIIDPDSGQRVEYYTQTPTYSDLPNWLRGVVTGLVRDIRLDESQIEPAVVERIGRINRSVGLARLGLVSLSETGDVIEAQEGNEALSIMIPAAGMFIMFFLVMSSCPAMLNAVLEEKMQRIAELLVSAVTPFQLMLGKLLGGVLVAVTLSALYVGAGVYMAGRYGVTDMIPPGFYAWFGVFTVLALFMYGSVFVAIGSACSEIRDSQTLMTPAMIFAMLPVWCWFIVVRDPNSLVAKALSMFPPFTPMLMLLRLGTSPGPPLWEVLASLVLTTLFTLICVWAGARVFRIGILSYGQAPTFRKLIAWAISG